MFEAVNFCDFISSEVLTLADTWRSFFVLRKIYERCTRVLGSSGGKKGNDLLRSIGSFVA